ncbi:MAG: hypothetical protein PUB18_06290 [bacterium]|nr:hypothetical protein [bacterium]
MNKNNVVRIIGLTLLFLYIGLYFASNAGYIDYQAKNQMVLTEEQIKKFEQDVKENKAIDIENYITNKEEMYDNNISRMSLNISRTISTTFESALNFVFEKLEKAMNRK